MTDFKCDVESFQVLLEGIETKLSEVKFEYVDFGITGSSSGLNAFVYSYVRLANLLVKYRNFVRRDIVKVCDTINGFIEHDNTIATNISGGNPQEITAERTRIMDSFQGFTNKVRNNKETIGSQTLPSISVSSFTISRLDYENMASKYTACLLSTSARISELCNLIDGFRQSSSFLGLTANAMKSYWVEIHIPIVKAIDTVLWTLNDYFEAYGSDLKTLVNDDSYFVFAQSEMKAAIIELTSIRSSLESIVDDVDSKVTSYSSILGVNVTIPNGRPMLYKYEQEATKIQTLIESLDSYESSKVSLVKNYIDEFVTNTTQLIAAFDTDKNHIENYKVGDIKEICNDNNITPIEDVSGCTKSMEKYIQAFETANPEYADAMDKFLAQDSDIVFSLDDDMKKRIKYWAYTAPEPYRTALMNSIKRGDFKLGFFTVDLFPIGLVSHDNVFKNSVNYTTKVLINKDMKTVFHEMGHACDDAGGLWWGSTDQFFKYKTYNAAMGKEVSFYDAMEYDVYFNPNNPHSVVSIYKKLHDEGVKGDFVNVCFAFRYNTYAFLSDEDKELYRKIAQRFMSDHDNYVNAYNRHDDGDDNPSEIYGGITDTYGGMTHNGIISNYDSTTGKSTGKAAWGHDNYYWNFPGAIAPTEFYAEYFSANVNGDEQKLAIMRKNYPEACKIADSYTKYLAGK